MNDSSMLISLCEKIDNPALLRIVIRMILDQIDPKDIAALIQWSPNDHA